MSIVKELGPAVFVGAGALIAVAVGFAFPPVVSRGGGETLSQMVIEIAKDQHAYCRNNLVEVNCTCFAGKAAHILMQDQPRIHGFSYMDRIDLARGQASRRC